MSMNTDPHYALVVDDDPRWRELVAGILRELGWSVTAVGEPPAFLTGYHLAVLDMALDPAAPDNRDGLTLLKQLTNTPTRCIFVSGVDDADLIAEIQQHPNVIDLIHKDSFQRETFVALIQQVSAPLAEAPESPNILIVEDDLRWRAIYEDILAEAGYQRQCAASYGEARGWLQRANFVLAVVDLHLASSTAPQDNRDGFWLLRAARQRGVPTIVVSALGAPEDIDRAYEQFGVYAFVEKEGFDRRAFARIVSEAIASTAAAPVEPASETSLLLGDLTDREREVLDLLTQGYTNRQIAEALLITPNTVKKHVDHILQKLGVKNRAGAVSVALRAGLNAPTNPLKEDSADG
jgi:DNA-binding NarL/FixJ family response regulator